MCLIASQKLEALEPSEGDTKKRRVESFDEAVDWFQREGSSIAWLTKNSLDEREIFEIDFGDRLESERSFCRESQVWLSKRLSDGNSSEVTYHRLLPGQQLKIDKAMTKELSHVLAADAVRRLTHEEELNSNLNDCLLRMRWVLTWKVHLRWRQESKRAGSSFWDICTQNSHTYRQQHQHLDRCHVICYCRQAPCTNFGSIWVMSSQLSCKHLL